MVASEVGKHERDGGISIGFEVMALDGGVRRRSIRIERLVIAGWTGRDSEAVAAHVRELEEVGVKPPSSIPLFYRAGVDTLTTLSAIEVVGGDSSGEVETVFLCDGTEILVAVGSDQTDRKVEAYSVAVSKQMCPKPISGQVWYYADVADHWDQLVLRSWALFGEDRRLYQEGSVSGLLHPETLFRGFTDGTPSLPPATAMYGGTLSAIGGIRPMNFFEIELEDPVLKRRLKHAYVVKPLPEVS